MPRQSPGAEVEGRHAGPLKGWPVGPVEKTKTTEVQTFPSSLLFSSPQWFQNGSHIESELNKIDKHVKTLKKQTENNLISLCRFFMGEKVLSCGN